LIEKADWYDRLIILSAFVLFLLVVGWILKRRVLDKLVGGLGWWIGGSFRLLGMGMGMGSSKSSKGASSLASAAVSSVGPAASAALAAAANRRKAPLGGLDQKEDQNLDQGQLLEESQWTSTEQPLEDLVPSLPEDSAVRPAGDGAPRDEL
jgi:protein transport protein SEC20